MLGYISVNSKDVKDYSNTGVSIGKSEQYSIIINQVHRVDIPTKPFPPKHW